MYVYIYIYIYVYMPSVKRIISNINDQKKVSL
jgi:hypothetical protein